jgi:hypothetical protein
LDVLTSGDYGTKLSISVDDTEWLAFTQGVDATIKDLEAAIPKGIAMEPGDWRMLSKFHPIDGGTTQYSVK